jgi:hypothetical protein
MVAVLSLCLASAVLADDFKTTNGKEYKDAKVSRVEPDGVVISFRGGIVKIPFPDLPAEIRAKYGYDPQAAADFQRQFTESIGKTQPITDNQTKQPQSDSSATSRTSQQKQVHASAGFNIEPLHPRKYSGYNVTYESADELANKQKKIAQGLMLSEQETNARVSSVPQGGQMVVINHGSEIYSTMTRNLTVIIHDKHGNEILRKTGDDHMPLSSVRGWIASMIVKLEQPIDEFITIYVVNNNSGYREEFRIQREH